ncbi:hypothetical protein PG994_011811 [Apiospora phragmitis]|uniref:Calcineurin-like phosphoesterase domain-containing protein n=1 Tax=Apiospora phragmitis TaxID=2905665 RepID=A0ABR1TTV4_9PEZI
MPASAPLTNIKSRGRRKRQVAQARLTFHRKSQNPSTKTASSSAPVRVVCISDTHNKQPSLPLGDVLIHAGDLTESGSFDEMQTGLAWLSSQPHKHKIYVAGNHDVLLDEEFLTRYPERRYGQTKTKADLDWGDVVYLQDTSVILDIDTEGAAGDQNGTPSSSSSNRERKLTVFGSPWTPQYGISAFQYRPDALDHWEEKMALMEQPPDILITHGPPRHYLDQRDFHRAGCPYLADMVHRLRPRLMVFGHIHAAYGRDDLILDAVQRAFGGVMTGWAGWGMLAWMAILVAWGRISYYLRNFTPLGEHKITTFVNAAVVVGQQNELRNPPIVVEI